MRLLNHLCRSVWNLDVIHILDAFVDTYEALVYLQWCVDRLVHLLIVGFKVHGPDIVGEIDTLLKEIAARDSKEAGVYIF